MTATTKLETTALTVVERAAVALGSEKLHGDLVALAKKSADITEIKNAAGRDQCHAAMMALANTRTSITKTGKAARDDANAFSKAVIAEEKRLIDLIEPEEVRLRTLRDGWDEAREAEKRAKAEAEAQRIKDHQYNIARIREWVAVASGRKSEEVAEIIQDVTGTPADASFEEFQGQAQLAKDETLNKLREMHAAAVAREEEAARLKAEQEAEAARLSAEREELARLRAEAAKREEEAAAARAVEEKRLADERAAQEADLRAQREAQERELDAERERQAAEAARIAEERAELERQQREREEAEERAAKAAADAKAAAERAEIERQQVELREQQEALERERADVNHAEFLRAGPGVDAIVSAVAEHFDVMEADALRWLTTYTFASME